MSDSMIMTLPRQHARVLRRQEPAKIAVLVSPIPHDGLRKWFKRLIDYAITNDNGQRALFIYVSAANNTVELRNISTEKRKKLCLSLIQILTNIKAARHYVKPIDLSPLRERCTDHLDVLSFVDYSENGNEGPKSNTTVESNAVLSLSLEYLPSIITQLSDHYDYIVIDLSEFQSPSIYPIIAMSNHIILPYVLNHEDMMSRIYSFGKLFMEMKVSGLPILISGIIPIFSIHDKKRQEIELAGIRPLFGKKRCWSSIPDSDQSDKILDAAYKKTFKQFFEIIMTGSYGIGGMLEDVLKLWNVLVMPNKSIDQYFQENIVKLRPQEQLVKILDFLEGVSNPQKNTILMLDETLAQSLASRFFPGSKSVVPKLILKILDMENLILRNKYLDIIAKSKDLQVLELAVILGITTVSPCLEAIALTKHWSLEYCENKRGWSKVLI